MEMGEIQSIKRSKCEVAEVLGEHYFAENASILRSEAFWSAESIGIRAIMKRQEGNAKIGGDEMGQDGAVRFRR